MKKYSKLFIGVISVIVVIGIIMVIQNKFDMNQENFKVKTSNNELRVVMSTPKNKDDIKGVVVFIHGDGPIDANAKETYLPIWEKLASKGYASIAWDKPGVKESSGNWLDQSIDDRAKEANEVIDYVKKEYNFKKVGLWSISQGGWVLPKLTNQRNDIDFNILVAPAINWIEQSRYSTKNLLEKDKVDAKDAKRIIDLNEKIAVYALENKSYEEYLKLVDEKNAMEKERWNFVLKNIRSDSRKELGKIKTPVLLITGGHDDLVDVKQTNDVYTKEIKPNLLTKVHIEDANHQMIDYKLAKSKTKLSFNSLFNPRAISHEDYLKAIEDFVAEQ